jgi:hypothetical protein
MPIDVVVTCTEAVACCPPESVNVTEQVPATRPVTVSIRVGPDAVPGEIVATPLHVSCSLKRPV